MKKKSDTPLLDEFIRHNARMQDYARILIKKAREYIAVDENGKIVRKYRKGKKLPKFRPGDRDNY